MIYDLSLRAFIRKYSACPENKYLLAWLYPQHPLNKQVENPLGNIFGGLGA